jgi:hypothetical protein
LGDPIWKYQHTKKRKAGEVVQVVEALSSNTTPPKNQKKQLIIFLDSFPTPYSHAGYPTQLNTVLILI